MHDQQNIKNITQQVIKDLTLDPTELKLPWAIGKISYHPACLEQSDHKNFFRIHTWYLSLALPAFPDYRLVNTRLLIRLLRSHRISSVISMGSSFRPSAGKISATAERIFVKFYAGDYF